MNASYVPQQQTFIQIFNELQAKFQQQEQIF